MSGFPLELGKGLIVEIPGGRVEGIITKINWDSQSPDCVRIKLEPIELLELKLELQENATS